MTTQSDHEARRSQLVAQLAEQAARLQSSDGWRQWLAFASRFRRYSLTNQLLILSQRPEATRVAGYGTWRQLGRQVKRGESGIAIYAPLRRKVTSEDSDEKHTIISGFRLVYVFDVDQTEGDPLPTWELPAVTVSDQTLLARMLEVTRRSGQVVELAAPDGVSEARGWYDRTTRTITLVSGYPVASRTRTLLHELAHANDPGLADRSRSQAELLAEAAAYVVGVGHFGIDMEDASAAYVTSWDGTTEALAELAGDVVTVARVVENLLGDARPEAASDVCVLMTRDPAVPG